MVLHTSRQVNTPNPIHRGCLQKNSNLPTTQPSTEICNPYRSGTKPGALHYRDYAISDTLIHWESQGVTREQSQTGQRYINHRHAGSRVFLFVRESVDQRAFWFLGPAEYVSHEGERPMAITWRLLTPLPNDLFGVMAAAA